MKCVTTMEKESSIQYNHINKSNYETRYQFLRIRRQTLRAIFKF